MQSERPTTELWVRMRKKNHGRGLKGRQRSQTWDGECGCTHVLRPLQQQNPMRNGIYALEMETRRKLTYGHLACRSVGMELLTVDSPKTLATSDLLGRPSDEEPAPPTPLNTSPSQTNRRVHHLPKSRTFYL